ncbi:hypothetical protein VIOR103205_13135 [Vibrio ordalii]
MSQLTLFYDATCPLCAQMKPMADKVMTPIG